MHGGERGVDDRQLLAEREALGAEAQPPGVGVVGEGFDDVDGDNPELSAQLLERDESDGMDAHKARGSPLAGAGVKASGRRDAP